MSQKGGNHYLASPDDITPVHIVDHDPHVVVKGNRSNFNSTTPKVMMMNLHLNIWKALLCSFAFLLQYTALYSAQNVQSVLFSKDNYGQLGFYSNAVVYFGQGTGSIFCVFFTAKYGDSKSMAWSSLFALPFIISLLAPAYKSLYMNSDNFLLSTSFVYALILFTSLLNGLGEGVA